MGMFKRLADLIKSNLNDLISRSEDPEKMLNQIVLDMSNQLLEAKRQVAQSIADEKRLQKQVEQETTNAAEWERRAMLAVRSGDDALAKEGALAEKRAPNAGGAIPKDPVAETAENGGRAAEARAPRARTTRSKKPSARRTCSSRGRSGPKRKRPFKRR